MMMKSTIFTLRQAPTWAAQTYRNTISNMANYVVIMSRLANSIIFADMEAIMTLVEQAKKGWKGIIQSNKLK